jgi:hypothetical protein
MVSGDTPFIDLPAALVEEVLEQTAEVSEILLVSFNKIREENDNFRKDLTKKDFIRNESSLGYPPLPTTCAADGSYGIERLLASDLVATAAVAVEGLTPPSEKRHWQQPRHKTFIKAEPHNPDTATVARAIMIGDELLLAEKAPHDLILIDGSLTIPIIYFNQALNKAPETMELQCSKQFTENAPHYLEAYATILKAERSDKNFVGLPKYSTRREIGKQLGWASQYDDRSMLTFLLKPGEFTRPLAMEQPDQKWHLNINRLPSKIRNRSDAFASSVINNIERIFIIYYKPHDWLPAIRIEVPNVIATNKHRLAIVIQGIKHQCATPSMLEPYPLYLADRTVKALARAIPAFRQVTTQRISEKYEGDIGEIFMAMHGYRSESGR